MVLYKKYKSILLNGKKRTLYIKSNSKSNNPILYIKNNTIMITYKQFLKNAKYNGGSRSISSKSSKSSSSSSRSSSSKSSSGSKKNEYIKFTGNLYDKLLIIKSKMKFHDYYMIIFYEENEASKKILKISSNIGSIENKNELKKIKKIFINMFKERFNKYTYEIWQDYSSSLTYIINKINDKYI